MARVHVDAGLFTTDVIVELNDSESKIVAAGGGAAAVAGLNIPPPFNVIVSAIIAAAAGDIAAKNHGSGVRIIVTIVTAVMIVSGWHVASL
jgi:hypothetical protein